MSAPSRLRVLVIAPLRFPIRAPHAGGLESAVWSEVAALRERGHEVTLLAVEGSDFVQRGSVFEIPELRWPEDQARTDDTYPSSYEAVSVTALSRALDAVASAPHRFDVISNHCLHPLPIRRSAHLGVPMITTLHTPPDDAFVAAHRASNAGADGAGSAFVSVSEFTRRGWAHAGVTSDLLANGIDPRAWPEGPGGDGLVWFGRIVPEKAPHLAIEVARRLGRPLTLAGRIGDRAYAAKLISPWLGADIRHVGVLPPDRLADLVGRSLLGLATPVWEEPFGLVAPESLMCGTPFVGFAVGGVPEIAARSVGMLLARPGDVDHMTEQAAVLIERSEQDPSFRTRVHEAAVERFGIGARIDVLEQLFRGLIAPAPVIEELSA